MRLLQVNDLFRITIKSSEFPVPLDTSCLLGIAPGLIFQGCCRDLTVTIRATEAPEISVGDDGAITLSLATRLEFGVVQADGSSKFAFSVVSPVEASADVMVAAGSPQKLAVKLALVSIAPLSEGSSNVGPLNCCAIHWMSPSVHLRDEISSTVLYSLYSARTWADSNGAQLWTLPIRNLAIELQGNPKAYSPLVCTAAVRNRKRQLHIF